MAPQIDAARRASAQNGYDLSTRISELGHQQGLEPARASLEYAQLLGTPIQIQGKGESESEFAKSLV